MAEGRRKTSHGDDVCHDKLSAVSQAGAVLGVLAALGTRSAGGLARRAGSGPSMTRFALASPGFR